MLHCILNLFKFNRLTGKQKPDLTNTMTSASLREKNFQLTDQQRRECCSSNSSLLSNETFNVSEDFQIPVWNSERVSVENSNWKPNMLVPREGDKYEAVKGEEKEDDMHDKFSPTARPSLLTHRKRKLVNPLKIYEGEELRVGDGHSHNDIVSDVAELEQFIKKKIKGSNDVDTPKQEVKKKNKEGKKKRKKREPVKKKDPKKDWRREGKFTHKQAEIIQRWFDRSSVEVCIITYKASDEDPEALNKTGTQIANFVGELKKCKSSFSVLYSNNKGEYEQQPGEKKKRNTKDKLNILIYTNVDRVLHASDLNSIVKHATTEKINVVLVTLQEKLHKALENHVNVTINTFEKFTKTEKPSKASVETKLLNKDGTGYQIPTVIAATKEETPIAETGHDNDEENMKIDSGMPVDLLQTSGQNILNVDQLIEDIFGKN